MLHAEILIPITVQKGTNLITITRQFCTSKYHWKEIAKINNLTSPFLISSGDVIYAPIELLKTEKLTAKVASVVGGVFILERGKKLKRVVKGDEIYPGQTLVTEEDGFTHIVFPDNKYTRISSGSKFTLTYLVRLTDKSMKAEFFLEKGRITHAVKKQLEVNETFTTRTPVSVTGVRGTEFRMKVSEDKVNIVETLKGIVNVQGDAGNLSLNKGEGTKVAEGQKPELPKKLPPTPESPVIDDIFRTLPVIVSAPEDDSATSYRLRITTDQIGNNTVLEKQAQPGGSFTLLALEDGKYYGFLTALDDEDFESLSASPFIFEVRTVPGAPIFVMPHEGKATFEKSVEINWLQAEDDDTYHLQLARDEEFSSLIVDEHQKETRYTITELEPGTYFFRVQSVAGDGFTSLYSLVDSWKVQQQASLGPLEGSNEDGVNLHWATMGDDIVYDLELSKNKDFTQLVVSAQALVAPEFSYTKYLDPANYYVRVRGVLSDGQVSPWTPAQKLVIEPAPFSWLDTTVLAFFLGLLLI
ncbi:hypothetical protein LA52FAK_10030 [Desulforhopalus sp. 52FAK]